MPPIRATPTNNCSASSLSASGKLRSKKESIRKLVLALADGAERRPYLPKHVSKKGRACSPSTPSREWVFG